MVVTLKSNPLSDTQLENRKELERKLAEEENDLELFKTALQSTAEHTDSMNNMLKSFDQRLVKLETQFIRPIHNSTSALTTLHTNLNHVIEMITTYTTLCNNVAYHELVVSKGY